MSAKRHPDETPVALWVPCVSPGIENEEGGVGFAKDVHAELVKTFAHRQANAVALRSTPFACLWRYQHSWQNSGILIVVEGK